MNKLLKSVTHGQCDSRPTVIMSVSAPSHQCPTPSSTLWPSRHRRRLPQGNDGFCPKRKTPHRAPPCEELDPPYDINRDGRGEERRERERKRGQGREFVLCPRKKKEKSAPMVSGAWEVAESCGLVLCRCGRCRRTRFCCTAGRASSTATSCRWSWSTVDLATCSTRATVRARSSSTRRRR